MKKTIYLFFLAVLITISALAQDKIYKTDGGVIEAKVSAINSTTIIYKRSENVTGPDHTIARQDVARIVYKNGTTDYFSEQKGNHRVANAKTSLKKRFGDNILTVIPAAFTAEIAYNSMNDPGIGLCYERLLDAKGHIGVELPLIVNFTQSKDFNSDFFYNSYSTNTNYTGRSYTNVVFMPGVKLYPADSKYKVRWGGGILFFVMMGKEPYAVYENNGYYGGGGPYIAPVGDWRYTLYGAVITNSLNISPSKNFYMELDANALAPFSDNRAMGQSAGADIVLPIMQFALKAGYRF